MLTFFKNIKRLNQIENEYKWRMKAGEDAESFRRQEPLVDHIGLGNQAEAAVSKLRRLRREEQLRADPGWQERVKGIDQQMESVMRGGGESGRWEVATVRISVAPPCKISLKFQFFNPQTQPVDLIGVFSGTS